MTSEDPVSGTISRRDVLKRGAVASGALVVGGTALSGTAAAKRGKGNGKGVGGSGFLGDRGLAKVESWPAFEVVAALDGTVDDPITGTRAFELEQAPGCTDGRPKTYQGYRVRKVDGDPNDAADNAILYLNPNRNVNTGVAAVLTDVRAGCEGDVVIDGDPHPSNPFDTNMVSFGTA